MPQDAPQNQLGHTVQPVLTAHAMREADRYTIETLGIPGFTLMETAGRAAVDEIEKAFGAMSGKDVCCFCGKGNNGGDGFVVARVLHARGARVQVVAMRGPEHMSDDAALNWHLLQQIANQDLTGRLTLNPFESLGEIATRCPPTIYVDALLGTGLTSSLRDPLLGLVHWLNDQPQPVVSLDVPTGLHSDQGLALGTAVRADLTVTMGALKAGFFINEGPLVSGTVKTVEIGIPRFVLESVRRNHHDGCALLPTPDLLHAWLPARSHNAHKYSAGMAAVVGGAPGLTGAPVMSALATARAGAGYVVCACPQQIQPLLAARLTEITTLGLPETNAGGLDADSACEALEERLAKADALLIGPGLGRHPDTQRFVRALVQRTDLPLVLDADGLNALAETPDLLARQARGRWILTPHAGEFNRLAGHEVDLTDRIRVVQKYARQWACVLILKGLPSLVGCPDGTVYINPNGNPALATAGTGDVLAGLCAGLLAQGLSPTAAAVCGLYLGGAAADRYARHYSPRTMMAMDLLDQLPTILHEAFS